MDAITLVWLILGGVTIGALGFIVLIISGKDIVYAFKRKLLPTSVDIYVANYNRQINHYLKIPKEGVIRIKGKPYVVNPQKVLGLSDDEKALVNKEIGKREERINKRIQSSLAKIKKINEQIESLKTRPNTEQTQLQLKQEIENLQNKANFLRTKLKDKSQQYYYRRKPALYYIEDDPIPKDFYEFYTDMDSIMIDNIIARAMTKDPKSNINIEKYVKMLKWILLGAAGASAATLVIAIQIQNGLNQIAQHLGVTIAL